MRSVLLIEDDADLVKLERAALVGAGYQVVHAHNGHEALTVLASIAPLPDVILLDLDMPIMNGWDLLVELRKDQRLIDVPVVVVSANADDRLRGTHAIVRISKPCSMDNLIAVVKAFT